MIASPTSETADLPLHPGLEGIVAAETRLSSVDGRAGRLIVAGFPIEELAAAAGYEEVAYLLWTNELPNADALAAFDAKLRAHRTLPQPTRRLLAEIASRSIPLMDQVRMAAGTLDLDLSGAEEQTVAAALLARMPTVVATAARLAHGLDPVAPDPALNHAANFLWMLRGARPTPTAARALERYLITVADHGLNASTFAARVIVATQSDLTSAVTGALGALKGPLHGGAPGPALDMVFEIGTAARAEPYLRARLDAGERLMGFGHRVYKVRDPRADVLADAARDLYGAAADAALYDLALAVEAKAVALLAEYKPGRNLQTNVEFYTALLLHGLGLESELFTPTFAAARTAGWLAHCFEQQAARRLIRPKARYVGATAREWVALEERGED